MHMGGAHGNAKEAQSGQNGEREAQNHDEQQILSPSMGRREGEVHRRYLSTEMHRCAGLLRGSRSWTLSRASTSCLACLLLVLLAILTRPPELFTAVFAILQKLDSSVRDALSYLLREALEHAASTGRNGLLNSILVAWSMTTLGTRRCGVRPPALPLDTSGGFNQNDIFRIIVLATPIVAYTCRVSAGVFQVDVLCVIAWKVICISGSGFFTCASVADQEGWRFVPLSLLLLRISGTSSRGILMALSMLLYVSPYYGHAAHIVFVRWVARNDLRRRVQSLVQVGTFRPALAEESFRLLAGHDAQPPLLSPQSAGQLMLEEKRKSLEHSFAGLRCLSRWSRGGSRIEVDREALLSTTLKALLEMPTAALAEPDLQVTFRGELGEDYGGVLRDWFDGVGRALTEEALGSAQHDAARLPLLMAQASDGSLVLRPGTRRWEDFFALGRLLALAVLHGACVPLRLSRATWKLLLGDAVDAEDVHAMDPTFYVHRVAAVLRPGGVGELAAALGEPLRFVAAASVGCEEPEELVPGGKELLVTEENKLEYVQRLCEFHLCGGVEREWALVSQGFEDLLPRALLHSHGLRGADFELLVAGAVEVDLIDWQANTAIDGPLAGSPEGDRLCELFWVLIDEFDQKQRAELLQFVTGSSRLPAGGFGNLEPSFCLYLGNGPAERLPTASTCANQLNLEAYSSSFVFRSRLQAVCQASSLGFGLV